MFRTPRAANRARPGVGPGTLTVRPQLYDASYDAATLAFMHLHERIQQLPAQAQPEAWTRVTRTLAHLPDPDLADRGTGKA